MKTTMRKLTSVQVFFQTLAIIFGVSFMTASNAAKLPIIPPLIHLNSTKVCGDATGSSLVTGGGLLVGAGIGTAVTAGAGAAAGTGAGVAAGAAAGGKLGLSCSAVLVGTDIGLCTAAGAVIGGVVGGIIANKTWKKVFGHHNCAGAIYTYEKGGRRHFYTVSDSESIQSAQRYAKKRLKKRGASNIQLHAAFDGWEVRCAAGAWGKDGQPYVGLGPSVSKAREQYNKMCKVGNTECHHAGSFCNSWKWFSWDHWGF